MGYVGQVLIIDYSLVCVPR